MLSMPKGTRRETNLGLTNTFAWGYINSLAPYIPIEDDNEYDNKEYVVTTWNVESFLFLMPRKSGNKFSKWIYDSYRRYLLESTRKCLTSENSKLRLETCQLEPHSVNQM